LVSFGPAETQSDRKTECQETVKQKNKCQAKAFSGAVLERTLPTDEILRRESHPPHTFQQDKNDERSQTSQNQKPKISRFKARRQAQKESVS